MTSNYHNTTKNCKMRHSKLYSNEDKTSAVALNMGFHESLNNISILEYSNQAHIHEIKQKKLTIKHLRQIRKMGIFIRIMQL